MSRQSFSLLFPTRSLQRLHRHLARHSGPEFSNRLEGPASFTLLPLSSIMALTRRGASCRNGVSYVKRSFLHKNSSHRTFSFIQLCLNHKTSGRTVRICFQFHHFSCRRIISRSSGMPSFVCADTGTKTVLPPQSSGISSYSVSSCFTRSILALGLSFY